MIMERCTDSRSRSYKMAHNVYTSSDKWCSKFMGLHVCFYWGECACVVIAYVVLCNSQKQKFSAYRHRLDAKNFAKIFRFPVTSNL
jgi:hypothetical protein